MIQARKQHPAFGLGAFTDLGGSNPSGARLRARARRRRHRSSVRQQPVPLPAAGRAGPAAVGGRRCRSSCSAACAFPRIGELPVPADPGRARLLLVPADRADRGGITARDARRCDRTASHGASLGQQPAGSAARAGPFAVTDVRRLGMARDRLTLAGGPRSSSSTVTYDDGERRALPAAAGLLRRRAGAARPRPRRRSRATPSSASVARLRRRARPRGDGAAGCAPRSTSAPTGDSA